VLFLAGAAAAEGEKVLVVDLERVIRTSKEGKDLVVKLEQQVAEEEKKIAAEGQKLQESVKELQSAKLADKTLDHYKRVEEALYKMRDLEVRKNVFLYKLKDNLTRSQADLMRAARTECERIMTARNADIVISTRTGRFEFDNEKQIVEDAIVRRVLCMKPGLDISDDVIAALDKSYAERMKSDGTTVDRESKGAGKTDG
jgi:Skp family chaperone for outer membrane proteins